MIVISIIIILAAVALPQYQKTIMHARETVLKDDLFRIRMLIDQYAADKGKLPQSLEDLVSEHYMREIPTDPITDQKEWSLVTVDDPSRAKVAAALLMFTAHRVKLHPKARRTVTGKAVSGQWFQSKDMGHIGPIGRIGPLCPMSELRSN